MKYLAKVTAIMQTINDVLSEFEDAHAASSKLSVVSDVKDFWLECDSEEFAYLIERLNFEASLHDEEI